VVAAVRRGRLEGDVPTARPQMRTRRDVRSPPTGTSAATRRTTSETARRRAGQYHPARPRASMTDSAPSSTKKIRVVVAKPGLDGHDRGAKIIARALRDAGMEVIYTGLHQTPEQIVETVIQEDADAVGLSILSGAHMTLVPRIVTLLEEQGIDDVVVTVGGTIPNDDIPELKRLGVAEVFTPGSSTEAIVDFIRGAVTPA
jgi:methylmalonyl-CoA mutase C-terminal domain/subunit